MAAEGELADPRVPSPSAIRPVMGFTRMSSAAYDRIRAVVDGDDAFRARVAEAADEDALGRAGWLWLTRPDGWEGDPVFHRGSAPAGAGRSAADHDRRRDLVAAEAKLARLQERFDRSEQARKRAVDERDAARADLRRATREIEGLRQRTAELEAERNRAVRAQKASEAELATSRHDLRLARLATREAEAEVIGLKAGGPASGGGTDTGAPGAAARPGGGQAPDPAAVRGAREALREATESVARLTAALEAATGALDVPAVTAGDGPAPVDRRRKGDRRRPPRRRPSLPPGILDDSVEAHRHLVSTPHVTVVVDGYNLAREAWHGLEPEEERRRTVALLEEVATRSGADVVVVFDGDDAVTAPPASRVLQVRFSATGVTADRDISELVASLPQDQPVLVVSTDREVADDARTQGAAVLSSARFLAAVGR